ncbi:MAG: hypothetical protein LBT89_03490 [Planctomycetaceae bacterium]|jgi:hypothetical protein|nr:hypothetical protein [Planctomycetaceae bacterium]
MQILDQPSVVAEDRLTGGTVGNITGDAADNSDELSAPHIGQWNRLVSQTNWEKGTCILRWRSDIIAAGLPNTVYSDDAWGRRVGISPQHVSRLRRVAERFADTQKNYAGVYWSHFNAALDWDDAELWLEGAVQNGWSVAQMKVQRAETVGALEDLKPRDEDIYVAEIEEDSYYTAESVNRQAPQTIEERTAAIGAADITEGFDAGEVKLPESPETKPSKKPKKPVAVPGAAENTSTAEALSKLQCLSLPEEFAEPVESLKLALLNHKAAGWKQVPQQCLADLFDSFKALVYSVDK